MTKLYNLIYWLSNTVSNKNHDIELITIIKLKCPLYISIKKNYFVNISLNQNINYKLKIKNTSLRFKLLLFSRFIVH